ncbi:MAG: hypothetical protein AB7Q17_02390 [Phycisphaerae bacterium]
MPIPIGRILHLALAYGPYAEQPNVTDPPEELRLMLEYRAAIQTAQVDSTTATFDLKPGQTLIRRYSHRCAPRRVLMTHRGNEHGIVLPGPDRNSVPPTRQTPLHYLYRDGEVWTHQEEDPIAEYLRTDGYVWDARMIGLSASRHTGNDIHRTVLGLTDRAEPPRKYSVRTEGNLRVVTAERENERIEWWLHPKCGFQPVRVAYYDNDRLSRETRSDLYEMDGYWFPRAVHEYNSRYRDGTEPAYSITVASAEFNHPDHPREFTPADIGIGVDTTHVMLKDLAGRVLEIGVYNGDGFRTHDERAVERGIVPASATQPAVSASGTHAQSPRASTPARLTLPAWESAWRKYTREFIERCQLTDDQAQKAWSICADCEKRAQAYVERHKAKFDDLDRRAAALRTTTSPAAETTAARPNASASAEKASGAAGGPLDTATRQKLAADRARLLEPINEIFERQLKPRLDALLTRAQRAATQPAHNDDK